MITTAIVLVFLDAAGKERTIRVDKPKEGLLPEEVQTAMETIIAKNIFAEPALVSAKNAYIVTTQEELIYSQAV